VTILCLLSLSLFKTAATNKVRALAGLKSTSTVAAENDEDRPRTFGEGEAQAQNNEWQPPWMKFPQ
jgi:hypothetical protein